MRKTMSDAEVAAAPDWEAVTFGSIAKRTTTGWRPGDGTLPYVGLEHIAAYELDFFGLGSSDDVASNKTRFSPGDILYGKLRPYFRKCVVAPVAGVCSTDIWVLQTKDRTILDQRYLYWLTATRDFSEYANLGETGTRMPRASWGHVEKYPVLLPPLEVQRQIADVLDGIQSLITSCDRLTARTAETIIAECHNAFDKTTSMRTMPLSTAAKLVNGGAYTKGADSNGRMVVRIKELTSGPSETTIYNSIAAPTGKTVFPGDVLFAWSGSLGVWRWYRDEAILNQHIFKVLPAAHPVWLNWVHIIDALESFQDIAAGKATTMGHITKDHLDQAEVPVLTDDEIANLTSCVAPLWDYQLDVGLEARSLRKFREFLLPRLLTGEVSVGTELTDEEVS